MVRRDTLLCWRKQATLLFQNMEYSSNTHTDGPGRRRSSVYATVIYIGNKFFKLFATLALSVGPQFRERSWQGMMMLLRPKQNLLVEYSLHINFVSDRKSFWSRWCQRFLDARIGVRIQAPEPRIQCSPQSIALAGSIVLGCIF